MRVHGRPTFGGGQRKGHDNGHDGGRIVISGGKDELIGALRKIDDDFHPKLMGVVGTCASMIIGENLDDAIKSAGIRSVVLPVDIHGCSVRIRTGRSGPWRWRPRRALSTRLMNARGRRECSTRRP